MESRCKTVLIIEDDPDIRFLLSVALEANGCTVLQASNGKEGLELLQRPDIHPCLILLDLMMPVMTGWEFLNELQAEHRDIVAALPVYVISAVAEIGTEIRSQASGFIKKPIDLDILLKIVSRHCC